MKAKRVLKFLSILILLNLMTCQNPFEAGLGSKADIQDPRIALTSHSSNQFVKGTITLAGTCTDDVKITKVNVAFTYTNITKGINENFSQDATVTDQSWSANLDTTQYTDGDKEFVITVTDASGKSIPKAFTLKFDNHPPVVLVKNPTAYPTMQLFNGDVYIRGEAEDLQPIDKVQVTILRQNDTPLIQLTDADSLANGTNAWTFIFKSNDPKYPISSNETLKFFVTATDKAGNANTYFYHYAEIAADNGNIPININQIADTENLSAADPADEHLPGMIITKTMLTGNRLTNASPMLLTIDQDGDKPAIDISSPQDGDSFGAVVRIVGLVTDDDGVKAGSIQVKVEDGIAPPDIWQSVTEKGSGLSVPWEIDLSSLPDKVGYQLFVKAEDIYNKPFEMTSPIIFNKDSGAPSVTITIPNQGAYKSADFIVSGNATSSQIISTVEVSWDNGSTWHAGTDTSGNGSWSSWSYTIDIDNLTNGSRTLKARVTDSGNKTANANVQVYIDKSAPTVNFNWPLSGSTVNGLVNVQGNAADTDTTLNTLTLEIVKPIPPNQIIASSGLYSWSNSTFDTTLYDDATYATDLGGGRWQLTLKATVTDVAANSGSQTLTFIIDQSTDNPIINITAPAASEVVGANTLIRGTISDDDGVDISATGVEVRIDSGTWINEGNDTANDTSNTPGNLIVTGSGLQVSYKYVVPSGLSEGTHTVTIRAKDTTTPAKQTTSSPVSFLIDLSSPTVSNISPAQGSYRNSNFTLSGETDDANTVAAVVVSTDNGATYNAVDTLTPATATRKNWTKIIDTSSMSGTASFKIKATDATGKEGFAEIQINIDKTNPTAVFTNPVPTTAPYPSVNGKITVQGMASDNNQVQSVALAIVKPDTTLFSLTSTGTYNWSIQNNFDTSLYNNTTYATDNGDGTWNIRLRSTVMDIAGNTGTADLWLTINQTLNNPVITFSNISEAGTTVLEGSPKILGIITDDDGVATMEVSLDGGGYISLGTPNNATSVSFSKDVSALADGAHTVRIRAVDISNPAVTTTTAVINYKIDREAPDITVTTPASNNTQQKAAFTANGTAADENGITQVRIKIDSNGWVVATGTTAWSYNLSTYTPAFATLSEGTHTITFEVTDGTGKITTQTRDFIKDTIAPTLTIINPLGSTKVNGAITVKGTTSDTNAITGVQLKIGKDNIWNNLSGIYNWEYAFTNIDTYANITYADETPAGSGIWRLYVHIRATDQAANTAQEDTYYLDLDPAGDAPITTIYQPLNNQTLGGAVRVYGIATDDDAVFRVEMAIDYNDDGLYTGQNDFWNGTAKVADGDTNDPFEKESVWYAVTGTSNWYQNINTVGEFNSSIPGQTKAIRVKVRAVDTKNGSTAGINGDPVEIRITFDNTVPIIENLKIDPDSNPSNGNEVDYATGLIVSKTFYIRGIVKDESGINQIDQKEEGPLSGTARIDNNGTKATYNGLQGSYYQYTLHIPIDTTSPYPFANDSGQLSLSLKATDNSMPNPFVTYSYLTLQIDNLYPSGNYTGSSEVKGDSYTLRGTATDTGTVSGVEKVVVYIVRRNGATRNVYKLNAFDSKTDLNTLGTKLLKEAATGELGEGTVTNVKYPEPTQTTSDYRIEINESNGLSLTGLMYDWYAQLNTANIPDGPIEIHYVIFDKGGNGTHYIANKFISNNPPKITKITIGTDINGDNSVANDTIERKDFTINYNATNYTARNNRLFFGITATGGNTQNHYSVKYGSTELNNDTYSDNSSGDTVHDFTIDTFTGIPDTSIANGAVFTVTVTDNTEITSQVDTITVQMNIDNIDGINPTITVHPFGQKYNVSNNPVTIPYNNNIVMNGSDRQGHIEYTADSQDGVDEDVSGKVYIMGYAFDNLRLNRLTAAIPGYDPDAGGAKTAGAEFDIATWNGSGLSGVSSVTPEWALTMDTSPDPISSLTEEGGHKVYWTFKWNSADITSITTSNLAITFRAYDFNSNTAIGTKTVDVVPYVTGLERSAGAGEGTPRTKYGKFTMQTNESNLLIRGFNLAKTGTYGTNSWVRVINNANGALTPNDQCANANVSAPAPYTTMTVSFSTNITHSGWLRIMVNNLEAINNLNNNTRDWHKEDDGSGITNTLWTDDRYLQIWETEAYFDQSQDPVYPAMDMDPTNKTLYASWSNYAIASTYYATTAGSSRTQIFNTYDPPEWTDIAVDPSGGRYIVYLQNYNGGGTGYNNYGNLSLWSSSGPEFAIEHIGDDGSSTPDYSDGMDERLYQFQNPRVATNSTRTYVSYYDTYALCLKYGYVESTGNTVNSDGNLTTTGQTDWFTINTIVGQNYNVSWLEAGGGYTGNVRISVFQADSATAYGTVNDNTSPYNTVINAVENTIRIRVTYQTTLGTYRVITNGFFGNTKTTEGANRTNGACVVDGVEDTTPPPTTTGGDVGLWSDVGIDPIDNLPVIAYYDTVNRKLKVAKGMNAAPTGSAEWYHYDATSNNSYIGNYVSMKLDASGNLFIATYKNSTGDLVFIKGTRNAGNPWYNFTAPVIIDSDGAVGAWPDIYLVGTTPYISYINSSMAGTFYGIKYAYYDTVKANWEYGVVPANSAVNNGRTSLVINSAKDLWGEAAIAYQSSTFDLLYLKPLE